jgi:hypothetical protein
VLHAEPSAAASWLEGWPCTTSDARMHSFCSRPADVAFISTALVAHEHAVVVSAETPMRPRLRSQQLRAPGIIGWRSLRMVPMPVESGRAASPHRMLRPRSTASRATCDGYTGAHSSDRTLPRNIAFPSGHGDGTGAAAIWRAIYDPRTAGGSCSSS